MKLNELVPREIGVRQQKIKGWEATNQKARTRFKRKEYVSLHLVL